MSVALAMTIPPAVVGVPEPVAKESLGFVDTELCQQSRWWLRCLKRKCAEAKAIIRGYKKDG